MIEKRAKPFIVMRLQHSMESAEDYTELIADLIEEKGEARTCDIARYMSISHVTAIRAIKRLQRDGYVTTDFHQPVLLTSKGKKIAEESKKRHALIFDFLIALGVPK